MLCFKSATVTLNTGHFDNDIDHELKTIGVKAWCDAPPARKNGQFDSKVPLISKVLVINLKVIKVNEIALETRRHSFLASS